MDITTIGFDLAKTVFQVHGADGEGRPVLRRKLRRGKVLAFFAGLPSCPWRIRTHAATGSSKRRPQCFSQVKLRSAAGCVTTLPLLSAGVSPSSDAWVREWLK